MAACIALALDSHAAWAQPYPTKPLTLVVPAAPGGIIDASARLVGDPLARLLGKTVVIDNKAGGSANVGYALVAHAPANGHTLLASYSGYHIGNPALTPKLPWSLQDLTPVALLTVATNVITVHPFLPVSNLQDLIAYLKKHPSQLSYASQGNGSV
jgi:tripartite-type tricarboxylate transporter receptor subunit TctC